MISRHDSRQASELRPITIVRHFTCHAEGSVLISVGNTKVICTASVVDGTPKFVDSDVEGWVTAEYGLLPRATATRCEREAAKGKQSGRTQEIQRLIGRSLRSIVNRTKIAGFTIKIDCDVIQADGGTRCASITGAYVALVDAVNWMIKEGKIAESPLLDSVSAISVGMSEGRAVLDLDYIEDSSSDTDMNVVMTGRGNYVEIQGTAEGEAFSQEQLMTMLTLARLGCEKIRSIQETSLQG